MKNTPIYSIVFVTLFIFKVKAQSQLNESIKIKNLDFNSKYSDFGAVEYRDSLILFSSSRKNKKIKQEIWRDNMWPYLTKYTIKKTGDNTYLKEQLFNEKTKFKNHVSSVSFNASETIIYFTANSLTAVNKSGKKIIRLKIYKSKLIDGDWKYIEELPFNSENYSTGHPSLSSDGKKLYFISDMPGGYGLTDVYMVNILEDGSYSSVINLGPKINTKGKEMFPFIDENNILYFSSNGFKDNMGGLDIYYADLNKDSIKVTNVKKPINSESDDFSFFKIKGANKGYFSSNRTGGKGDDDIYSYNGYLVKKKECKDSIKITFKDSETHQLLDSVSVFYKPELNKLLENKNTDYAGVVKLKKNCFLKELKVLAYKKGYSKFDKNVSVKKGKLNYILFLEKDFLSEKVVKLVNNKLQIIIGNIYFGYNKYNITKDSEIKLNKLISIMNKYPKIKININSHTDSRGKDLYNLKLSENRALSIRNYIINNGIKKDRILFEGHGEKNILNRCVNNIKCTKEEHLINRRTTFLVVEEEPQ